MEVTEYVELLDVPVYTEDGIIEEVIASEAEEDEMHEIEYINHEEVIVYNDDAPHVQENGGHTILMHDGKQYMIPSALHQNGGTIVFEEEEEEVESDGGCDEDITRPTTVMQEDTGAEQHNGSEDECNGADDDDDDDEQQLATVTTEQNGDTSECYLVYGGDSDANLPLGRQYAVLRDGKLHIQAANTLHTITGDGSVDVNTSSGDVGDGGASADMHEKLQAFEHTLNSYSVVVAAADDDDEELEEDELGAEEEMVVEAAEGGEQEQQITGRNLITGQTISLNGFLEKMKRKIVKQEPIDDTLRPSTTYKRQRRTAGHDGEQVEYMLVPPVNKRVIVGKTPDGKRIIGKILQIQKKLSTRQQQHKQIKQLMMDDNNRTNKMLLHHHHKQQQDVDDYDDDDADVKESTTTTTSLLLSPSPPPSVRPPNLLIRKKKCIRRANAYDQNIVRTLSGLMELESIEKNLAYKNLIVKHVLKHSVAGKVVPGKQMTYYTGHMERRTAAGTWTFVSSQTDDDDDDDDQRTTSATDDALQTSSSSINLRMDDGHIVDSQQVNVRMNGDGKMMYLQEDDDEEDDVVKQERCHKKTKQNQQHLEYNETVTVNLIVTQDEHGKKRTKVIIPQLGGVGNKTPTTTTTTSSGNNSNNRCQTCDRVYKSQQQLHRHQILYQHGNSETDNNDSFKQRTTRYSNNNQQQQQQQFQCHICNKSFNTSGSLRRHISVHDPSMRPLQCMVCMQRFTDESSLRKHMVLHTGVRPYQCEICARCFVHQGDLNFHRKIHDPVKRYRCDVCGKQFNRHSNMIRHSDIHRPTNTTCITTNSNNNNSVECTNTTTGPPYICDTCGCQYNFVSSLTRHIVNNHMDSTTTNTPISDDTITHHKHYDITSI